MLNPLYDSQLRSKLASESLLSEKNEITFKVFIQVERFEKW
jgi:hypothetical protein